MLYFVSSLPHRLKWMPHEYIQLGWWMDGLACRKVYRRLQLTSPEISQRTVESMGAWGCRSRGVHGAAFKKSPSKQGIDHPNRPENPIPHSTQEA